jgi:hypothetical protein
MNCPFCQQSCVASSYYDLMANPSPPVSGWKCERHPYTVEILSTPDEQYYIYDFICSRGIEAGQYQEFTLEYCKFKSGDSFSLREGNRKRRGPYIIELDFIPEYITPDNIDKKLSTLLVWS